MGLLAWGLVWLIGFGILAYHKTSRSMTCIALAIGFVLALWLDQHWFFNICLAIVITALVSILYLPVQRKQYLIKPLLKWLQAHLPRISETERIALEAGTTWWDSELFSGDPQWQKLFNLQKPELSEEEKAFLQGPVDTLCKMINDWDICYQSKALSPELWQFLKTERFFALIIPKSYGGLEFSAFAHSEILAKIAGRSLTIASVVAVPNSLGPAELILKYGTEEQKNYYLPRLASGLEIPCFALTSLTAGSDAGAIQDRGVICTGLHNGQEILGIRLNWDKRYTTLAPIATLLGLAFKLFDPDHLLGGKKELGITCALVPANLPGITLGQHHMPLNAAFPNGPTQGKEVFIPLDWIIGGTQMAGQGWRMLVECLSAGRAISLPSSVAGSMKMLTGATGAYATIRRQFKQPIGHFGGIEEVLARMIGNAYLADAARTITAASIDQGEAPSVLGAIIKSQLTERARQTAIDSMDIHGGKAIMMGPKNYIALQYQIVPISITVEGANILTRSMIIFGQGAIRAHPYLLQELQAVKLEDTALALEKFDFLIMQHALHFLSNISKSFWRAATQIKMPCLHTKSIERASAAFAVLSDVCLMLYGGKLKSKEKLSGRLADCLSMMYLASCVLKRFEDDGRPVEDKPLIDWILQDLLSIFWKQIDETLSNLPKFWIRILLRIVLMPFGSRICKPSDALGHHVARLTLFPNPTRDRLLQGVYLNPEPNNEIGKLELVLAKVIAAEKDNASEEIKLEAEKLRQEVMSVDYFGSPK